MTEEEKRQEKLLLLLLALAGATEYQINKRARKRLLEVTIKIRKAIQRMSPTGNFRAFEWVRLRPQIQPLLTQFSDLLRSYMLPELQGLIPEVQDAASDYAQPLQFEPIELRPKSQAEIAQTNTTGGKLTIAALFGTTNGPSRFSIQMGTDLDRMVRTGILQEKTTQEIADKALKVMQYRGKPTPVIETGSYANQMWNRVKNTTAGAAWSVTSSELLETWKDLEIDTWVWNAVMDSATCPICQPLHGQTRPVPSLFPRQPPIHPNCRCAVFPQRG